MAVQIRLNKGSFCFDRPLVTSLCTSDTTMLSVCSSRGTQYIFHRVKSSFGTPQPRDVVSKLKTKSFRQRYTTEAPTAKAQIADFPFVVNPSGLEQKSIVDQTLPLVSYCRCWLSSTFPKCDGSHKAHNLATGTYNSIKNLMILESIRLLTIYAYDARFLL